MPANQFLTVLNGIKTLVTAVSASTGSSDGNKIISTDSSGKLDSTFLPSGVGVSTKSILASEALSAGDFVNVYNNSGTANVRKADNSNGRFANGFVLSSASISTNATVYLQGENTSLSGLTIGTLYYLGTGGSYTTTLPTASNSIIQALGTAISATSINFEYDQPIVIQ